MKLCDYGCGQEAKYQFKNGKWCCSKNHKSCPSLKSKGIPESQTNKAFTKVPCLYCGKNISYANLKRHIKSCCLNPINIKYCKNCNKILKDWQKKFCSSSCAATTSNSKRKHTLETKRKISSSLGGKGIAKEERVCSRCGKIGIDGDNFCMKCSPTSKATIEAARKSWYKYEKKLLPYLEKTYGKLNKEIINNIAFDFCNSNIIIEFTFDYGRGTSELIKRFKKINDNRKKVAFVPSKWVGIKRREKLNLLGIEIESSDPYLFLK